MPASESNVANPSGSPVRNLRVTTLIDGQPTIVMMPVIALADADGNLISQFTLERLAAEQLEELRAIRQLLTTPGGFVLPPNR